MGQTWCAVNSEADLSYRSHLRRKNEVNNLYAPKLVGMIDHNRYCAHVSVTVTVTVTAIEM
jgi:hypothetical protein